jgi:hypothetical protein
MDARRRSAEEDVMCDRVWIVEVDGKGVVGVFSTRERAAERALAAVEGLWPEDEVTWNEPEGWCVASAGPTYRELDVEKVALPLYVLPTVTLTPWHEHEASPDVARWVTITEFEVDS